MSNAKQDSNLADRVCTEADELSLTITVAEAAKIFGFSYGQTKGLVRNKKIAHVNVGSRVMIPRDAIAKYLRENTVQPCQEEIQDRAFAFSKNVETITSSGPKMVAAASVQRALRIASSLKPPSPTSCTSERATRARESQKKF
jgi:excisionase family DNA binding protein